MKELMKVIYGKVQKLQCIDAIVGELPKLRSQAAATALVSMFAESGGMGAAATLAGVNGEPGYYIHFYIDDIEFYAAFIQDNKFSIVDAEIYIPKSDRTLGTVHVNGQIDHVLADPTGKQLIVDHKFGGAKYKEKDLVDGKSLQLALYSKLVSGQAHPDLAYHIINNNKILVLNKSFNRAQQVNGPDSAEVLLDAERKIAEKAKILKSGKLTAHGLIDENARERFHAPCGYCEYKGICGLAWKQEA